MRAHVERDVSVHLAPIEVGNATRNDAYSSTTLQKESKQVKRSSGVMKRYTLVRFASSPPATHKTQATVNTPAGRFMKVQGKFKIQAHRNSGVVMDIAAFKVSHSVGCDPDATALRAARAGQAP